jgi:hypothetical protein
MRLKVDPAARAEAEEAAMWYESQQPGLGWRFFWVYEAALESIERNPESFPILETLDSRDIRYCLLKPYSFRLGFRVQGADVLVFAVGHIRRDRTFWASSHR